MPLSSAPRPPRPSRVAAILGDRGDREDRGDRGDPDGEASASARAPSGPIDPEALDTRLRRARRPGLVTVPEQLRLGRLAVSTSAIVAVLALVLAVGCAFVIRILWAERASVPRADGERPPAAATPGVTVSGRATAPARPAGDPGRVATATASAGGAAEVVVHVVGQVKKPGLVRLPTGARVADALAAAGGATKGADLTALNLARPVTDGEQVHVPRPGEKPPVGAGGTSGEPGPGGAGAGTGRGAGGGAGAGPVNLNTADLSALDSLPGVGPVLAQRILDWRTEHGRFSSVEELGEVSGIGDKLLAQLRPKVTL